VNAELSCRQCRDALVELTAGTLSPADRLAVERHLVSCAECQRERDAWLALGDAIRERGQRLPTDGGFATGLVRLRTAVTLHDDNDVEHLRADGAAMGGDPLPTAGATPMHGRSYPALTVTVAVVLLSALIFSALATRLHLSSGPVATGAATPTATPTATPFASATPHPMPPLPAGASVISIAMTSASDGWAAARAGQPSNAILLHYAGGRWTPSGDTFAGVYLTAIAMDSHDDGWAVGAHSDQVTGVVLHYTGGHWSQVQTPNIQFAGAGVWAFSPSRVLVLASLPKGQTGIGGSALLRYDNGAWSEIASPRRISGMSVLSADDLWATCFDGHILHYQAGQWTTYTIAGQAPAQSEQPLSISMTSDGAGWLGGLSGVPKGMFLARFEGHAWTRVQGPAAAGPSDVNSIAMVSPSEGWAGGDLDTSTSGLETVLLHYVNGQWETTPAPYSGSIGEIVMVSATEGWATVGGGDAAGLLHYQDGRWTPYIPNA
jgi:hypothetical protein